MALKTGPRDANKTGPSEMDYDDGRVLWPVIECDLLIVDDVDGSLPTGTAPVISATRPLEFAAALKAGDGPGPLAEVGGKRTGWGLGSTTMVPEWKMGIVRPVDVWEGEIMNIQLQPAPPQTPG